MKKLLFFLLFLLLAYSYSFSNPQILSITKLELTGQSSTIPPSVSSNQAPNPISPTFYEVHIEVYQSYAQTSPQAVTLLRNNHYVGQMSMVEENCWWDSLAGREICSYQFESYDWAAGGRTYNYCAQSGQGSDCESIAIPN